jgi:hypothetical protein
MPISRKKKFTPLLSDFFVFSGADLAKHGKNGTKLNTFYKTVIEFLLQSKTA